MLIKYISSFFITDSSLIWTRSHQIINSPLPSVHNLRIFYWARKSRKQIYHQRSFKYRRISHGWQNCPRNESLQVIFIEIDALFLPSKFLNFIYSEEATKFCEISTLLLWVLCSASELYVLYSQIRNISWRSKKILLYLQSIYL